MKALLIAVSAALIGSLLSFAVIGAQSAKTPSAVAFVSASRILNESTHGRSEAARLQALQQQRETDLRAKQQALDTTRRQLATSSDATARIALQQKELDQRTELERTSQQAQVDFQALQREVNLGLQQRLKTTLDELMKTQGYQLVLNSDTSVMWSTPEVDLTSAVINRMNGQ